MIGTINTNSVRERLGNALARLLEEDRFLLVNDLNERSISHTLAEHLQTEFADWHVDCEYNRNYAVIKRLREGSPEPSADDAEARTVYPDIVVHRRNADENLLVVEIKKSTNSNNEEYDLTKLRSFLSQLHYTYGAFIKFETGTENVEFTLVIGDKKKESFH